MRKKPGSLKFCRSDRSYRKKNRCDQNDQSFSLIKKIELLIVTKHIKKIDFFVQSIQFTPQL